ncbi:MAG: YceI family protein [Pseudomonadota bacterium]
MKPFLMLAASSAMLLSTSFAQEAEDRGLSTLSSGTYALDKTHGYVTFSYSHQGYSYPILRFDDVDGVVNFNAGNVTASTLSVDIDPASINSAVPDFDEHLVSSDFFDVENHPEITFSSTSLNLETPYSGTLTGDLTVKGVTKPLTLDVTLNKAGPNAMKGTEMFGVTATGQLDRRDFDLGLYAPAVGAEVDLRIEAEFMLQE